MTRTQSVFYFIRGPQFAVCGSGARAEEASKVIKRCVEFFMRERRLLVSVLGF